MRVGIDGEVIFFPYRINNLGTDVMKIWVERVMVLAVWVGGEVISKAFSLVNLYAEVYLRVCTG